MDDKIKENLDLYPVWKNIKTKAGKNKNKVQIKISRSDSCISIHTQQRIPFSKFLSALTKLAPKKGVENPFYEWNPSWDLSPLKDKASIEDTHIKLDECLYVSKINPMSFVIDSKVIDFDEAESWSDAKVSRIVNHWFHAMGYKLSTLLIK